MVTLSINLSSSPLEFQDDYFANDSSIDNDIDNDIDNEGNNELSCLQKSTSEISLHDNGIMFNGLKKHPTSGINTENILSNENLSLLPETQAQTQFEQDPILETEFSFNESIGLNDQQSLNKVLTPLINETESSYQPSDLNISTNTFQSDDFFPINNDDNFQLELADDSSDSKGFFKFLKHFFIISSAGKPIYSMHGSNDVFTVYSGIIQTIVSFFEYSNQATENIRIIKAKTRSNDKTVTFAFVNHSPIILMASSINQISEFELIQQLDFLYNFLLLTLSKTYIEKIFSKRENFDLRKLLGITDILTLDTICNGLSNYNNISLCIGGLECLKMKYSVRTKIEKILLNNKSENLLYGLIVASEGRLVDIVRPKRHTLHTSDLGLIFEMIYNTNTFKSPSNDQNNKQQELTLNEAFWVPICLPKFNPNGFLYASIQFIDLLDERFMSLYDLNLDILTNKEKNSVLMKRDNSKICIITISPFKDGFFEMRKVSNGIIKDIKMNKIIYRELFKNIVGSQGRNGTTGSPIGRIILPYDIKIPIVKHFILKSRKLTQFVYSTINGGKVGLENDLIIKGKLMKTYSYLKNQLMENGGSYEYVSWKDKNNNLIIVGMMMIISGYEVYMISNGDSANKNKLIESGLKIVKWCKKNEHNLFITSGGVF